MNKRELKLTIRAKKAEMDRLSAVSDSSKDVSEVLEIGDTLKKLRDEINALEDQLMKINVDDEEGHDLESDDEGRSAKPAGVEMRSVAAFGYNGTAARGKSDSIYLRSNESMISRLPMTEQKKNLDLGKFVRGAVTGRWEDAAEERAAMTTDVLGVVIPQYCAAEIIDAARNISLFTAAEVPVVPMASNNLTIARVVRDPVFGFKAEGAAQAESNDFELSGVELKAKTCYGYAYVSLETIHSATNLRQILMETLASAMADAIDKGMLYGGSNAPKGIMNDDEVNVIVASNNGYADFVKAIGAVRRANGVPTVMGINADTEEILSLLCDEQGQPLNAPKAVDALNTVVSNQLAADPEKGSDALVFDPNAMVIGIQNHLVVRIFQDSDYCIQNGMVGFQVYSMLDCAAVRPSHISKITGIKATA